MSFLRSQYLHMVRSLSPFRLVSYVYGFQLGIDAVPVFIFCDVLQDAVFVGFSCVCFIQFLHGVFCLLLRVERKRHRVGRDDR